MLPPRAHRRHPQPPAAGRAGAEGGARQDQQGVHQVGHRHAEDRGAAARRESREVQEEGRGSGLCGHDTKAEEAAHREGGQQDQRRGGC